MGEQNSQPPETPESDFTFIKEKIKNRPINKRKLAIKVVVTFGLAVLFGLVAATVYVISVPRIEDTLYPEVPDMVDIPGDEEILDDLLSDNSVSAQTVSEAEPAEEPEPVINNIIEKVEIETEDYALLYDKLYDIAREAKKSVVNVTGVSSDKDWFQNTYENMNQASGLIIADNGKELLILVDRSVTEDVESIRVEFCNGKTAEAVLKKYDPNTNLAIIGIDMVKVSDGILDAITMANLGSSNTLDLVGSPVIAIGSPLGTPDSVSYGVMTSISDAKSLIDAQTRTVTTDIYGSKNATGAIINYQGEVLGIISKKDKNEDIENLVGGYAISDIKETIERMSNGQDKAYLGIYGTDVTQEARNELGIPAGTYVTNVEMDSPAMDGGIQSGDVITKIGTTEIGGFSDYEDAMSKSKPEDVTVVTVRRYAMGEYSEMTFEITLGVLQ